MIRWVRSWFGAMLWSFAVTGVLGLIESLSQWLRFGPPETLPDVGPAPVLLPAVALYGWLGLAAAALAYLPASLVVRLTPRPRLNAFALAVGAALALVLTVYFGYLIHETAFDLWWTATLGPLLLAKALVGLLLWPLGAWCVRRVAEGIGPQPGQWVFVPIMLLVVTSAQWPSWREMRASAHTSTLTRLDEAPPPAGSPNLLLLSIDALRADHLSCLDSGAPPTPHLDALAAEGSVYAEAWGVASWTLPNMATIHTGHPPRSLGLTRERGLPDSAPTLAELAWRHGWRTGAVVTNPFLGADFGFQRGFELFDHSIVLESLSPAERTVVARELTRYWLNNTKPDDAGTLVPKALAWLDDEPAARPFFLWVHMLEPHLPYHWHSFPDDGPDTVPPVHELISGSKFESLHEVRALLPDVDPVLAAGMHELYRREVRYADQWAGRLLDGLRERGVLENTVVIMLSDHGEEFFEHGGFEHGHSLMPEVTRVPLIVRLPGGRGAGVVRKDPVTMLDLVPSICREMGWTPPTGVPGRAALWATAGTTDLPGTTPVVLENMLYGSPQQGWWSWPWFRVEDPVAAKVTWYDLAADSRALSPLPMAPPGADVLREEMRTLLNAWDLAAEQLGAHRAVDPDAISDHTRRQLESLGY